MGTENIPERFGRLRPNLRASLLGGPLPLLRWELVGYGGLLVVAAAMRLWDLGSRALHHDESLHAMYSYYLANGDGYQHNPMMHGPLQFESNAAIFFVFGDSDFTARLAYAVMGTLLVVLPVLFRTRLGRPGAMMVAVGLAFSPTLLYFSRFARNDVFIAVWTLGLVIAMWRYLDEGRNRYLYAAAALLALLFTTKETAYIVTPVLGSYLVLMIAACKWTAIGPMTSLEGLSPPGALKAVVSRIWTGLGRSAFEGAERHGAFLILLVTLTMVQWSALTSYFQDTAFLSWSNLVLARPVGSAHIGSPEGGGLVIAFLIVTGLVGLSIYWGAKWKWSVWWRCALIFWTIWILLYSTFFTNLDGIGSGVWQSLGYWVAQQEVARGNQPWYYYFIVTSVYEFLPFIFAFVAAAYFAKRGDPFGRFLIYWAVATFVLYTYASEKMPWLVVNITLPLIVLTGKMLGDIVERMPWRRAISNGGLLALPGVPLFIVLLWQLAFFEPGEVGAKDIVWLTLLVVGIIGVAALGVYLARAMGVRRFGGAAALSLAVMLAVLSVRTGAIANYKNADTPVELLVYTQTAPDIVSIVNRIREADQSAGERVSVPVSVDQTSGFTWPWAWYLRGRPGVDYPLFDNVSLQTPPDSSIVLVHLNNKAATDKALKDTFTDGERFKHRWWFPESAYRDITVRDFLASFRDRGAWRRAMDYFLHREGVRDRLGSEDAFAYFADELELSGAEP